jgi:hypothetical protein
MCDSCVGTIHVPVYAPVTSPRNIKSDGVFCNSDCHCCSLKKSDIQALENEVMSMTEFINILRDELNKEVRNFNSTFIHSLFTFHRSNLVTDQYAEKLNTRSTQCCKCTQLESQLQVALHELSSVKLITNIL